MWWILLAHVSVVLLLYTPNAISLQKAPYFVRSILTHYTRKSAEFISAYLVCCAVISAIACSNTLSKDTFEATLLYTVFFRNALQLTNPSYAFFTIHAVVV